MAGQQTFRLVDISKIDVKMSVPENEVSAIKIGAKAHVSVSALGGRSYEATVREKGIEANPVSHTYDIKLAVAATDGRLMPGMVCSVSSSSSVSSIISVPLNAVKLDADNRRFVWLVVKGKAHQQYVSLGDFTESGVIVTSGLKVGDCVITDGSQKVSEGMEVSTGKSPSPTPGPSPAGRRVV